MVFKVIVSNSMNTATRRGPIDDELLQQIDDIEGFAMWYLNHEPKAEDMRSAFGFKADYNGIGVYLFKHRGNWRMMSIYNQGLEGLTVEAAVNNLSKCNHRTPKRLIDPFLFSHPGQSLSDLRFRRRRH